MGHATCPDRPNWLKKDSGSPGFTDHSSQTPKTTCLVVFAKPPKKTISLESHLSSPIDWSLTVVIVNIAVIIYSEESLQHKFEHQNLIYKDNRYISKTIIITKQHATSLDEN